MKQIPLNGGQFALVDDEDYEHLNQWKWTCVLKRNTYYAQRINHNKGNPVHIKMHRLIMGLNDPKIHCDHIDRNGLNNQKSNLREATLSQNHFNQRSRKNGTSKYLGVSWDSARNKWTARIQTNYVLICIGRFENEIEAAKAYNDHAVKHHKEFASLNII